MECNQKGCHEPAAFRFTWPGKDEAGICSSHEPQLRGIASAMGLYIQIIPISEITPSFQKADDVPRS